MLRVVNLIHTYRLILYSILSFNTYVRDILQPTQTEYLKRGKRLVLNFIVIIKEYIPTFLTLYHHHGDKAKHALLREDAAARERRTCASVEGLRETTQPESSLATSESDGCVERKPAFPRDYGVIIRYSVKYATIH